MRKVLLSLLLASVAATPAIAGPRDRQDRVERQEQSRDDRQQAREDRQQAREERQQSREQAQPRFAQPQRVQNEARPMEQGRRVDPAAVQAMRERRSQVVEGRQQAQDGSLRRQDRRLPGVLRRGGAPEVSAVPRRGTQPPLRADGVRRPRFDWSKVNWRLDDRYDWQRWRNQHGSIFHLGYYYDPFGWGYQPYQIGWRLWPSYYGSRYWINDPWQYRLPYAPAGYRWVRYYDDALLVDTWSGEVVDVIRNFFW